MDRLHFIPMSASDMSTQVTGDISDDKMMWHNKDVNLWSVLNRVAEESAPSPLKMFKKFKATVVKRYKTNGVHRLLAAYVVGKSHLHKRKTVFLTIQQKAVSRLECDSSPPK